MWVNRGVARRGAYGWVFVAVVACGGVVSKEDGPSDSGGRTPLPEASPPAQPACGNGRIDPGEVCDGKNFAGATCQTATMGMRSAGALSCNHFCSTLIVTSCKDDSSPPGNGGAIGAGGGPAGRGGTDGGAREGGLGGNAGATYGDPHLFTADGVEYDFQAVGEFVLLEDRDDPSFVVQVRQEPFRPFTTLSSNTAVAALVGADRVALHAGKDPTVTVDGIPRPVDGTLELPDGGSVSRADRLYTFSWPTGERLVVSAVFEALLDVTYVPARHEKRRLHGLIGTPDGNPRNDFVTRQGKVLPAHPDGDALYDTFGASYRITPAESLFDYAPGQDTRAFTDIEFPHGDRASAALSPRALREAYLTCVVEGVTDVSALEACTKDVALTGDPGFARAAAGTRLLLSPIH